jgi:hypothetical protein
MLEPVVEIDVRDEGSDMRYLAEIAHIVILPKGAKDGAVQPVSIADWNGTAQNLMGASVVRIGKSARFALDALPPGEFDIVAATQFGEYRGTVGGDKRTKLGQWCAR